MANLEQLAQNMIIPLVIFRYINGDINSKPISLSNVNNYIKLKLTINLGLLNLIVV